MSEDLANDGRIRYSQLRYAVVPGYRPLTLNLIQPTEGARAVCVYLHGGGWRIGSPEAGPGPVGPTSFRQFRRMARAGLAVASTSYRLSGEARFPAQRDDVLAACRYLAEHADGLGLNGLPLGLWGVSAGGHLAALRALDDDDPPVRAAVCWYTPSDLLALPGDQDAAGGVGDASAGSREGLLLGAAPSSVPDLAREASPVARVHAGAPPFLLVHGTADTAVPFAQSERFATALRDAGADVTLRPVDGYDHMFTGMPDPDVEALVDESVAFLLDRAGAGQGS